jgi:hypothetical protein
MMIRKCTNVKCTPTFTTHGNSACVRIEIIILPAILYNIYILLYVIKYEFTENLDNLPSVMVFSLRPVMLLLLNIHRRLHTL